METSDKCTNIFKMIVKQKAVYPRVRTYNSNYFQGAWEVGFPETENKLNSTWTWGSPNITSRKSTDELREMNLFFFPESK